MTLANMLQLLIAAIGLAAIVCVIALVLEYRGCVRDDQIRRPPRWWSDPNE